MTACRRRIRVAASALRTRAPLVVLAGVVLVSACSSDGSKPKGKAHVDPPTTMTTAPAVAPLTGLADPGGAAQGRPVVSIKIDNGNKATRPQTGIEGADIVWDEVVEGEATRFLAMFQSQAPDVVGPVRSVRLTDPLIVWPVGGIFAYSGGAKYAVDGISQAPVVRVDESAAGDAMFRDSSRKAPYNLYAKPSLLFTQGGTPVPPPPLFDYSSEPVTGGTPAAAVHIGFSAEFAPTYTWDAASSTWKRSTRDGPFVVKSGEQVAPVNVVVVEVAYAGGVGIIGAEAQLVGTGTVQVFTNGRVIAGTWARPDKAKRMELRDANNAPIRLTPGQTWVELPDTSYTITVTP